MSAFEISNWKPIVKGALRGFFSVALPSGMVLHDCTAYEKDGKRWVNGPSKSFTAKDGKVTYKPLVDFADKATRDKFSASVLAALDAHVPREDEAA
jgi:DNA-binding cell septation regulator SpoVG